MEGRLVIIEQRLSPFVMPQLWLGEAHEHSLEFEANALELCALVSRREGTPASRLSMTGGFPQEVGFLSRYDFLLWGWTSRPKKDFEP